MYTSWLAKAHQKWFHSLDYAWPSTAHYDHPVVWVLVRFIPTYIPAIVVRPHIVTFLIYMVFVSLEETLVYSGYTFMSMNWFLNPMARRLEDHMLTRGGFNYGSWGLFDFVFNTSVDEDDPDFIAHLDEPDMEVQMKKAMSDSKKKIRLNTLRRHTRPGGRGHARRHGE